MKRVLLALVMICSFAKAHIQFILEGTANESKYGYISGDTYEFKFVVNGQYNGGSGDILTAGTNHWSQTSTDDPNIFNHIISPSFSGEYTPVFPSGGIDGGHYELSIIEEDGYQELWFTADVGEGNTNNIGLFMPDGTGISDFAVEIVLEEISVPYSTTFTSPTDFWYGYNGMQLMQYGPHSNSWFDLEAYGPNAGSVSFTPTALFVHHAHSSPYNFRHDLPFRYESVAEFEDILNFSAFLTYPEIFVSNTNIYNAVTNISTYQEYPVGIFGSEFISSFSNQIVNGTFQQQDPQYISAFIDADVISNFWMAEFNSELLVSAIKGDLVLRDGMIIQNYHFYNLTGRVFNWTGNFYVVVDNSTIYAYESSYATAYADNPLIDYDAVMTMSDRISTIDPIPNLIGVTNTYNFSSNSSYQTRTQLMNTIQLLENQASILSNDYASLEEELETIYDYTNRMTMYEAQEAMRDLRVGSQTFGVSNGNAKIRMFVDESSDLTSTWSNTQHFLELDIPADADTKFYRFRMD